MLTLNVLSANDTKDELFIDYQSGSVGFTVISEKAGQLDFSIEKDEWLQMKAFIEQAISREGKNKTCTTAD